jgi:hypothetical protein
MAASAPLQKQYLDNINKNEAECDCGARFNYYECAYQHKTTLPIICQTCKDSGRLYLFCPICLPKDKKLIHFETLDESFIPDHFYYL